MVKQSILLARTVLFLLILSASNAWAGWWKDESISSKEKPLCQNLYHRLKKYTWASQDDFWTIAATDPDLTEPPWQDLVPNQHKELMQRLTAYRALGRDAYFDKLHPLQYSSPDEFYDNFMLQPVLSGARLQVWRSRISEVYDRGGRTAAPGEQVLIQWRTVIDWGSANFKIRRLPQVNWQGASSLVLPDLSGPDPAVDESMGFAISNSSVLLYRGEPFFFDVAGIVFHSDKKFGMENYCQFRFYEDTR